MKTSASPRWGLVVSALGVVFGDIGTSPLYAFQAALNASPDTVPEAALDAASLILWSLLAIVTCKYVLLVMSADYKGEGGIFALLALLAGKDPPSRRLRLPFFMLLLMFGAALIYGDGCITPAISVLSAVEGLKDFAPQLTAFVLPITLVILLLLFAVQRIGTGPLGAFFGGIMLFWFITLGVGGLVQILQAPEVFAALDPRRALGAIFHGGPRTAFVLAGVVLAVTGVEALYADMGHFGRRAVSRAWHCIVLPSLILNYLGLAAIAIRHPGTAREGSLFFRMVPQGIATLLLVILGTLATIIASQALISGVFSLTTQARDLGLLPRFLVQHTSRKQHGQVYLPVINWHLAVACLLLVVAFRSSANLAAAYGLAVTGTMVITSIAFGLVVVRVWRHPPWIGWSVTTVLLCLELPFFLSSLVKFAEGGWFPIAIACILMTVMLTWHKGRALIRAQMLSSPCSTKALQAELSSARILRVPGTCVIITSNPEPRYAIARCFEWMRRSGCLREKVILLSLVGTAESHVKMEERLEVAPLAPSLWHVISYHGYMQGPDAPKILMEASKRMGCVLDNNDTFFVLPREMIVEYTGKEMPVWQRKLFGALSRNMSYAPDYFFIPCTQIIGFNWMLKV
ncbi:MAG: KUP/HAK/KT family potassium transporter [Verrucomicrobia bacterium]|nr:KUP/HAK/KT family potassium transporter [Verrucomicrobiota bacterium]